MNFQDCVNQMFSNPYSLYSRFSTFITIIFLPTLYNPISTPKFSALMCFLAYVSFFHLKELFQRPRTYLDWIQSIFIFSIFVNVIVNRNAIDERLFGVSGRNIGLFSLLAIVCMLQATGNSLFSFPSFRSNLLISNLAVAIILLVQTALPRYFDFELFYGVAPSTLGNPNIISAFLGLSFLSIVLWFIDSAKTKLYNIAGLVFAMVINTWALYECNSVQGFVILIVTLWSYLIFKIYSLVPRRGLIALLGSLFILSSTVILLLTNGLFGFSRFAETTSLFARIDYWRAGWKMLIHNPVFGVGLDGYGDYFRTFRNKDAFLRFGEGRVSDSAHNVYIDFFANGGVVLGITFILMNFMPVYFLIKLFKTQTQIIKNQIIGLLAFWTGLQVTLVLSVSSIPLLVWLALLLGSIKSLAFNPISKVNEFRPNKTLKYQRNSSKLVGVTLASLFLIVSFLPLKLSYDFLRAANTADGSRLLRLVDDFPRDSKNYVQVARGAADAGFFRESLELSLQGLAYNPRNFELLRLVLDNPASSEDIRNRSMTLMREIDPFFTT